MTDAHDHGEPLLGRWTPVAGGALAWVVHLAREQADTWLSGQSQQVAHAAAAAPHLPDRMHAAVARDAPAAGPEAALREEFAAVRGFLEGHVPSMLLGMDTLSDLWQRAREDAGDVFDQLGALLQGGCIETRNEELRLFARSMVDWSGNITTAWTYGLRGWEAALHRENVALALRAREAALAGTAAAARGAARLAALIAAPAPTAAALTLPLAWRYLRRHWRHAA